MGVRKDVKTAVQAALVDTVGVKKVFTHRPKLLQQTDFPSIVVTIPRAKEQRMSATAPVGKKMIHYTCQLEVTMVDMTVDGSGQLVFDDLLDAIDSELRKDPTLGGTVIGAAVEHITTNLTPPQLVNGQSVALLAIKQFDISVMVTG